MLVSPTKVTTFVISMIVFIIIKERQVDVFKTNQSLFHTFKGIPFKGKLVEKSVQVSGRLACQRGEIKSLVSNPSHLLLLMGWRALGLTAVLTKVKRLS